MYSTIKIALIAAFSLLLFPISSPGLGVELGPFSINMKGSSSNQGDPICSAIRDRHLIEVTAATNKGQDEKAQEEVARLLVEPYTLGYNKKGDVVLLGYSVKSFKLAQETPKESSEKADEGMGEAFIGGLHVTLREGDLRAIKGNNIRDVKIVKGSDFKIRDKVDTDEISEGNRVSEVICTLQ